MFWMIASISLFTFLLVLILFNNLLKKEFHKKSQLSLMTEKYHYIDEDLEKSFFQRFIMPFIKKMSRGFSKAANKSSKNDTKNSKYNKDLETMLRQAGMSLSVYEYQFLKLIISVVFVVGGLILAFSVAKDTLQFIMLVLLILMAIIAIPRFSLKSKATRRAKAMQNQLPNMMDVLSVSIEAGLGFDAALLRAIEKLEGPLIDEFALVYKEIQLGRSRRESLASLGKRNNIPELQLFTSAIIQSEQFGTPIKNVLKVQSSQLRVSRRQAAQEKGMKAPVKMVVPMVLFIFPVIFIILLGPTVINVIKDLN